MSFLIMCASQLRQLLSYQLVLLSLLVVVLTACSDASHTVQKTVDFNRDIRPILNENCTGCHGGVAKQSGVSFIIREEALGRGHSGRLTVVPGDPDASGLIERIESKDPNIRMPYKAPPLPPEKIALLRQWIKEGAAWQEHWAFEKPEKQVLDNFKPSASAINEIDYFVQNKLAEQGLSPSIKADKASLLRRLSLDLTGLPPTLAELNEFITDPSSDAYTQQVDRLLASPHFGERWASMWLDIARYADSKGYTKDQYRATWPYRDWVIDAFNSNKSYKDFVVEQLAGDLLPNRTLDNMVATAFHRQTPINNEGGTDDEEFRVVAMLDRVATTWSALNGITMNCVQCHSHPYDPIFHDEFYTFYGFLNSTQDADKDNDTPLVSYAVNPTQRTEAFELQEQLLAIKQQLAEQAIATNKNQKWQVLPISKAQIDERAALILMRDQIKAVLDKLESEGKTQGWKYGDQKQKFEAFDKNIASLTGQAVTTLSLKSGEVYEPSEGLPAMAVYKLSTTPATSDLTQPAPNIHALRFMVAGLDPVKAAHTPEFAYNLDKVKVWHVKADGSETPIHFASMMTSSTEVLDHQIAKLNSVHQRRINKGHAATQPLKVNDEMGGAVSLFAQRLFNPRWTVAVLAQPITLAANEFLRVDATRIQGVVLNGQPSKLRHLQIAYSDSDAWLALAKNEQRISNIARFVKVKRQLNQIKTLAMPVMYEQDSWDKRGTALFARGNFLAKEDPLLSPDTPKIFPPMPDNKAKTRLAMAEWFFQPDQPLTARVAVNRFWHALFGLGLVETLEDFGSIGAKPSHPKLLDWLALTFQKNYAWDSKKLIKLIVSSATYQQQAHMPAQLKEQDPYNKWLARGPKQRLTAEMIRDQALLASGLLSSKMGGMGVMPMQPDKIWGRAGTQIKDWTNAEGEDRYRRAVYTFIKRQYTYPSFVTFDMESREISHARRIPTNTPLQALVTLNDPVYHEAAQALAKLMLQHKNQITDPEQAIKQGINLGFQRVLSRDADSEQINIMQQALNSAYEELGNKDDLGAWTAVASILLNFDLALTR